MRKIRTLVVDDEPLARARILKLLKKFEFVNVVGECKNGREAGKAIQNYKPDLVFLDIQMPDQSGFEVLQNEAIDEMPFVIFVTAFDKFALRAFDVNAVDYLLKPYDDERFAKAVEHAYQQIKMKDDALLHKRMVHLLEEHQYRHGTDLSVIEIKEKGRTLLLKIDDIQYVEADGNYLRIYEAGGMHLLRETLHNFEKQIDPSVFLRIHRSIIVNKNYVIKINYKGNNQFQFLMKNDTKLLSSRGYREEIVSYLDEVELKKKI